MRISRFIRWHAARSFVICAAAMGILLCISGAANATSQGALRAIDAIAPAVTTTTLTTAPVSTAAQGIMVTLNAAVSPATAVGNVQFKDGSDNLGNPVALSNGTASGTTKQLAVGSRQLSAVFTPTDPAAFTGSMSPAVTFMVTAPPGPVATNTALTASSTSITQGSSATLTATVTPAAATGTVQFKDGTDNLGSSVTVSNATASVTPVFQNVGARQLTAEFTPADTATFSPSKSPPLSLTVIQSPQTVTQQAQQSGQSLDRSTSGLDGSRSLDAQGLTVLDLGGLRDGGGVTILDGGNVGGGLTILDLGGRNDGRGGLLDGGGLTLLRGDGGGGGGLISDLLNALL